MPSPPLQCRCPPARPIFEGREICRSYRTYIRDDRYRIGEIRAALAARRMLRKSAANPHD